MNRLTKRNDDGSVKYAKGCYSGCEYLICSMEEGYQCNHQCEADIVCKLADYEDAEEQGLLLKLPCKVGDTIYQPLRDGQINEYKIIGLVYDIVKNEWAFEVATQIGLEWLKTVCYMECIGKTVFLTKEEAEQKLKEMESD